MAFLVKKSLKTAKKRRKTAKKAPKTAKKRVKTAKNAPKIEQKCRKNQTSPMTPHEKKGRFSLKNRPF